jgi:hypothetical protein
MSAPRRECGHENRGQTLEGAAHDSFPPVHAFCEQIAVVRNQQNTIPRGNAEQRHEAHQRCYAHDATSEQHRYDSADQRERKVGHDEHSDARRAKLGEENQEDERD